MAVAEGVSKARRMAGQGVQARTVAAIFAAKLLDLFVAEATVRVGLELGEHRGNGMGESALHGEEVFAPRRLAGESASAAGGQGGG